MVEKDEERQEGYWPRVADAVLQRALRASGAVQIVGAKWCGKTETAKQQAQSAVYLQDPDEGPSLVALAEVRPSVLLEGAEPHLIDEWQMAPQLWDAVRFAVDQGKGKGRFILTGSATPKKRPKHSGVGRISRMHMRPMSLFESRESTGAVSLAGLFDGAAEVGAISDRSIEDIAFALCRGGWPEAVLESDPEIALDQAKDYVAELLDSDIDEMDEQEAQLDVAAGHSALLCAQHIHRGEPGDHRSGYGRRATFGEHGRRLPRRAPAHLRYRGLAGVESGVALQDRRAHQPDAALLRSEHRGGPVGRVSAEALAGL